ncbi:uncharacterized protein YALI1_C15412g [Yarrowia lipolytica]|uniref:Uncharacterized protein n=1 Tax=Yarrowia lipolytica TaxID=4952 RepID=A0A1D8NAM0_YARLL|nr:hypothetical protein YALI1_C15412g [Yarrowia lipolytica]
MSSGIYNELFIVYVNLISSLSKHQKCTHISLGLTNTSYSVTNRPNLFHASPATCGNLGAGGGFCNCGGNNDMGQVLQVSFCCSCCQLSSGIFGSRSSCVMTQLAGGEQFWSGQMRHTECRKNRMRTVDILACQLKLWVSTRVLF